MLQAWVVLPVALAYIGILFAIARYGDMRADQGRSIIANLSECPCDVVVVVVPRLRPCCDFEQERHAVSAGQFA